MPSFTTYAVAVGVLTLVAAPRELPRFAHGAGRAVGRTRAYFVEARKAMRRVAAEPEMAPVVAEGRRMRSQVSGVRAELQGGPSRLLGGGGRAGPLMERMVPGFFEDADGAREGERSEKDGKKAPESTPPVVQGTVMGEEAFARMAEKAARRAFAAEREKKGAPPKAKGESATGDS